MADPDPVDPDHEQISDDALSVANARFYRALESADLELMSRLWSHGPDTTCAHPGRQPLIGWSAIEASWVAIFGAGGNPQVIVTGERVVRRGTVGWVTITENMIADGHTGAATAINVFEHDGRRWLMVAHHAAPVLGVG